MSSTESKGKCFGRRATLDGSLSSGGVVVAGEGDGPLSRGGLVGAGEGDALVLRFALARTVENLAPMPYVGKCI